MATFRVGVGSFNINDGSVGIGTEGTGHGNLKVEGTLKSTSADVLGVSTFTRYSGFNADEVKVSNRDLTLSGEYSTIGDVVVEDGASLTVGVGSTACIGTVESVSVENHFSVPSGDIAQRDESAGYSEGCIRYNIELGTMEFFNGNEWRQFNYTVDVQNSAGRGITAGSYPGEVEHIEFINISTKGNSLSFGDMTEHQGLFDAASSSTRMVTSGGYNSSFGGGAVMDIQYVTIASAGNTIDFGDQTQGTYGTGASSSSTRALIMGGNRMPTSSPFDDGNDGNNTICTIEIATIGNAIDFGDLSERRAYPGACGDSVRMVIFGGYSNSVGSPFGLKNSDTVKYASHGNAIDFGDLSARRGYPGACGDPVRMVIFGGYNNSVGSPLGLRSSDTVVYASHGNAVDFGDASHGGSNKAGSNSTRGIWAGTSGGSNTYTNIIYSVSIQSLGDSVDFGDRTYDYIGSAMASQTRLVMAGGKAKASPHATTNIIDFVEFASSGNAQDFGDIGFNQADGAGTSDCHGGLGGY